MVSIIDRIFVSSGAFGFSSIQELLRQSALFGISRLELSAGLQPDPSMEDILAEAASERGFVFRLHNYFPPPEHPFVMNLASDHSGTLARGMTLCREALGLCARLGVPYYSVHAGFCFHAEPENLGMPLTRLPRFSMDTALETFIGSIKALTDEAANVGLELLLENNVLPDFNTIDGENRLLLGVTAKELLNILISVGRPNLKLLLDVGHLKVSARTLGLDPVREAEELAAHARAVHLSENDGTADSNGPVTGDAWFWDIFTNSLGIDVDYVLELHGRHAALLPEQITVTDRALKKQGATVDLE